MDKCCGFLFGITLNFVLQVILYAKIVVNSFNKTRILRYIYSDLVILILVLFYGIMNFLIGTDDLSGIGIGFNVLIDIYATELYKDKKI